LAWRLELGPLAAKQFAALDKPVARWISDFLRERMAALYDPRDIGEALKGAELGRFWKYRVGDWRVIASIEDQAVRILVVRIGNRRSV
jgi:mRNA interferase RelE/StbE